MTVSDLEMIEARKILRCLRKETEPRIERLSTHPRMRLTQEIQDKLRSQGALKRNKLMQLLYRGLDYGEGQFNEAVRVLLIARVITKSGDISDPTYTLAKKRRF